MSIKTETVTAPIYWACYLINGDPSGLDDAEIEACDRYMVGYVDVIDMLPDTERFTWSYDLYGGLAKGGMVVDYMAIKEE